MLGMFFRHRRLGTSTCMTHVPWCMPGSLTRGRWRVKRSPHSQRMRNQQFCVSGKRPTSKLQSITHSCRWFSVRLQYLKCVSSGDTAFLHQSIDMTGGTSKRFAKVTAVTLQSPDGRQMSGCASFYEIVHYIIVCSLYNVVIGSPISKQTGKLVCISLVLSAR